mmetsp:Transcript_85142/g.189209  ORF Transcript_85142/g.189209 Transcript_85142/m.189209 type:complete len:247 (-) Transcript_85142:688-1428(-)
MTPAVAHLELADPLLEHALLAVVHGEETLTLCERLVELLDLPLLCLYFALPAGLLLGIVRDEGVAADLLLQLRDACLQAVHQSILLLEELPRSATVAAALLCEALRLALQLSHLAPALLERTGQLLLPPLCALAGPKGLARPPFRSLSRLAELPELVVQAQDLSAAADRGRRRRCDSRCRRRRWRRDGAIALWRATVSLARASALKLLGQHLCLLPSQLRELLPQLLTTTVGLLPCRHGRLELLRP